MQERFNDEVNAVLDVLRQRYRVYFSAYSQHFGPGIVELKLMSADRQIVYQETGKLLEVMRKAKMFAEQKESGQAQIPL
ncbi:MAG TPA: hypothetical protein DD727_09160 [Clostridiales bacterium]|nr:hypothetical protein [Clostridiales bacterium]